MGLGVLAWLVVGLVSIRTAARLGHIWGFHLGNPLLGRAAIVLQAPALILECAVMDHHYPDEDSLAVGAARLMVAKFREPRADFEVLLEKLDQRSASVCHVGAEVTPLAVARSNEP